MQKLLTWLVSIETRLRSKETVAMDADSSEDEIREIEVPVVVFLEEYLYFSNSAADNIITLFF